jgi:hypothetical protein
MAHAEVDRSREPDRSARHHRGAARLLLGFLEVAEQLHRALVKGAAAFGQAEAAGRAVEKPGLQVRFEFCHVPGGRGGRQSELRRRGRKAPRFNHLREDPQGLESVHGARLHRLSGQSIPRLPLYPCIREFDTGVSPTDQKETKP